MKLATTGARIVLVLRTISTTLRRPPLRRHGASGALAFLTILLHGRPLMAADPVEQVRAHPPPVAGSFGVASGGESFGDHPRLFPLLREAGVGMVRSFPEWPTLEPERGLFTWEAADALVESGRKNQVQVFGVLCYLAPWASSAPLGADHGARTRTFPIKDIEYWREFVEATVARYRNDITYWEVYNEFNSPSFARNATVGDYVGLVKNAYEVAKQANPNCRIGIGCADVDISFLEQVITQGAGGCFDFVNVHPYSLMAAAMGGREPVFLQMGANLRKMLQRTAQRADIELWVSEIGITSTTEPEPEQRQAEAVVKAFLLCQGQGIERVFWFEGRGPAYGPGGDFGLIREDWTRRPAFLALQTMTRLLGGRPARLGWLNLTGRSYGFVFQGASEPVLAMWASSDKGDNVSFISDIKVTDIAGKATAVKAGAALPLTRAPVFVTGLPVRAVTEAKANHDKPFPWLKDYSQAETVSCQMGAANVEKGVMQIELGDGKTVVGLVDGMHVRRTSRFVGSEYMYFDADDSYASVGDNAIEITLTARVVDPERGASCTLTYEAAGGYRDTEESWNLPRTPECHSFAFRLQDANFANNWGWNFRIRMCGSPGDIWVKEVAVKRIGPKR